MYARGAAGEGCIGRCGLFVFYFEDAVINLEFPSKSVPLLLLAFETMSWVTVIWSMLMGACVAMALPHLLVGLWHRHAAHLFFVLATASVISIAVGELSMMRAESVEHFVHVLRWMQLPIFFMVVALVSFIHLYLGAGRLWLGISACAMRFACVIVNFVVKPSLSYREITGLRQLHFLGDNVSAAVGVISPRIHIAEFSSVLLFLFLVDASIGSWRKGTPDNRRRALVVGGSTAFFVLLGAGMAALTQYRVIEMPYVVTFPFAAILFAMAFDLSSDLSRARIVAQKLEVSEASLHESEERFRTMADAAPVMIWMSGLDKLCTFFNKAWLDFTGRTMEQELGNGWAEGVHLDDVEKCSNTYVAAFDARESFSMQYRLKRHDGEYRWITDQGAPRCGPRGNFRGYVGACVDITDLLEQRKALHEFEERVALAAEVAHLGVWELNTVTNELWMSDKARELFQFPIEAPVTYTELQDRAHPEDRAMRDAAFERSIETQAGYEIEYRALLPDGTVRWINGRACFLSDEKGNLTRLLGVSMDVTERKQAQELFQVAAEASPSGTLLVDAQGRIVLVNAQAEKLFNYWRDELIGKPVEVLLPERFATAHVALRAEFLGAPKIRPAGQVGEVSARRKDGTEFPVEVGLNPIQTPHGTFVLATVTDISARKLAEEEARRQREQINLLTRVSLLGVMTASIAHEINQPLSGIANNANAGKRFIDRGDVDIGMLRAILVDIGAGVRRASEVIRNIRNTIKKGAAIGKRIKINDVVADVTHMVQPDTVACSCQLQLSLAKGLPLVEGDPIQIQQVLINLVMNACDAMRNVSRNRRNVEIATERNGDGSIRVSVRDHGPGISDEAREHLFDQFFTTKEDGLGMGLAIVRSIIEAHGGEIDAENVKGGGARFRFTLPAAKKISK